MMVWLVEGDYGDDGHEVKGVFVEERDAVACLVRCERAEEGKFYTGSYSATEWNDYGEVGGASWYAMTVKGRLKLCLCDGEETQFDLGRVSVIRTIPMSPWDGMVVKSVVVNEPVEPGQPVTFEMICGRRDSN